MRKYLYEFKLSEVFDKNNILHLWIISFAIARQDLIHVNNLMLNCFEKDILSEAEYYYFSKMMIVHLDESITLIEKALSKSKYNISDYLKNVGDFVKRYEKLYEDEDYKIVREFINLSRNCFVHYYSGYKYNKKEKDFDCLMNILSTLEENEFETGFIKTGSILFDDFYFADDIQINWINYFAKKHNLTVKEILKKIVIISGRITFLLNLVVNQFFKD